MSSWLIYLCSELMQLLTPEQLRPCEWWFLNHLKPRLVSLEWHRVQSLRGCSDLNFIELMLYCTWSFGAAESSLHINLKWKRSCSVVSNSLWIYEAYQAFPSMGFSRQEHWSGLPFPSPGALPDPGIEPRFPALRADALASEPPTTPT